MKNLTIKAVLAAGLFWVYGAAEMKFEPHVLFKEGGGNWGQTGVGDFDNDGKLDFVAGIAFGGAIYWWRNTGDLNEWEKHTIHGGLDNNCVGGDAADMDGDGLIDWVSSGYWFKNHGEMTSKPPEQKPYNGGKGLPGKDKGCHDIVVVDIDGDGHKDIMNQSITWWKNPGPDNMNDTWKSTQVSNDNNHGGVAPYGYGDMDGDGDMDIVEVKRWQENKDGKGTSWETHQFTTWGEKGKYGWEFRVVTADFDGDEDLDIAVSEGDAGDGTAAWVENVKGDATEWETHELPFGGVQGDMHSIGAQDFDNDGDMDIAVPKNGGGQGNEWLVFENTDGKGTFQKHEVYKGFGAHETVFGDFDGDDDVDMVSKCWCGGATFVLLENKSDPSKKVNVQDASFRNEELIKQISFNARVSQAGSKSVLEVVSNESGQFSIELFNMQGVRLAVISGQEEARGTIPLQAFKTGVYLVRLNVPQGSVIQRVILTR
jgi:hypothetical protein